MISPSDSFDFNYHRDRDDNVTDYDPESHCHSYSPHHRDDCDDEESETTNERLLRLIESCEGRSFSVGGVGGGANEVDAHRLLDLLEKEAAAKAGKRNGGTDRNDKTRTKTSDRVSGDKSNFQGRGGSISRARLSGMGSVSDGSSNKRNVTNCPSKSPHNDSVMSFDGSFTSALLGGPNPPSDDEKEHEKNCSSNANRGYGSHGRSADIKREKERQVNNSINLGDSTEIRFSLSDGSDHKNSPGDNFNSHLSNNSSGNNNGNLTGSQRGSASSTLSCSFTSTHSNNSYKLEEFNNSFSSLLSSEKKSNTSHQQQPLVGGSKAVGVSNTSSNNLNPYSSPIKGGPHSTRHHSFDNPFKAKLPVVGKKSNAKEAGVSPKSTSITASSLAITPKLPTIPANGKHDNLLMDIGSGGDVAAGGIRDIRKESEKEEAARRHQIASRREDRSNNHHSVDDNSTTGGDDGDGEDDGHSTLAKYSKYHSVNVNRNSNRTSGTLTTASSTAASISHDSIYIRPLASECSQLAADENSVGKRDKGKGKGKGNSVSFRVQETVTPKEQVQDRYHDDEDDDADADDEDDQNSDIDEDDETATTTHHTPSLMAEQPSNATPNTNTFSLGSLGSNAVTASTHQSRSAASRTTRSSKSSYSSYGTHSTNSSSNHSVLERRHRRELVPGTTGSNASKISFGTASSYTSGSTSYCSDDGGEYDEEEVTDKEGIYARRRRRRHHRGGSSGSGNGGWRKSRKSKSGGGSMGSGGKGLGSTSPSLSALLERDSKRPILGSYDNQRFPVRFPKGIHEENEDDVDDNDDNGTDTRAIERSIGVNFLDGLLSTGSESTGGLFGKVSKVRDALRNEARSNNNNFGNVDDYDDELFASLIRKKQVPQAFCHVANDCAKPINANEHDGDTTGDESSILSNILNSHLASNFAKQRRGGSIVSETTGLTTGASTNISSPNIKAAPSSSTKRLDRDNNSKSSKRRSSSSENHYWWRTLLRLDIARKAICNNFVLSVNPWSTQSVCQGMVRFYHEGGSVWPRSKKEWIQWGVFALIMLPILNVAGIYISTSEASLAAATKRYYGNEVQYFRGSEGAGAEHRLRGARSVLHSSVAKSNAWAGSSQVMLSHSSSLGENMILMPDSDWLDLQISRNQAIQASSKGFLSFFRRGSAIDSDLPQPPKRLPLPPMLDHLHDSASSVVLYFITASNGKDIADQFDPANILSVSELNTQANTKLWKDIQTRLNPKPSDVWPCWNHNSLAQFREDGFVLMYPMKRRVHAEKALKKLARDFGQPVFYEFITWTETPSESDFGTGTTLTRVGDAIEKASERASSIRRVGKDGSAIIIPALPGGATDVMIRTTISVRGDQVDVPAVVMRRVKDLPVEDELTMREFEGPPEDEVVWKVSAE